MEASLRWHPVRFHGGRGDSGGSNARDVAGELLTPLSWDGGFLYFDVLFCFDSFGAYLYIYTHNLTLRIRTLKWKGFVPLILYGVSVPCYGEFHEGLMYLGPTYCSEPEGSQQQNQPSRLRGAQPGPRLLRVNLPSQVVHQFDRLGQVEHLFHSAKDGGQHNHGVSRYQGSPHMSFVAPVLMPSRGDAPSV